MRQHVAGIELGQLLRNIDCFVIASEVLESAGEPMKSIREARIGLCGSSILFYGLFEAPRRK